MIVFVFNANSYLCPLFRKEAISGNDDNEAHHPASPIII